MAKKKEVKTKTGRPKVQINEKQFIKLCEIQCTLDECCAVLGVCDKSLIAWCKDTYGLSFKQAFKKFSAGGKASLRRSNFAMAKENATMAIWLSKQHLGEQDNPELVALKKAEFEFKKQEAERQYQLKLRELELKQRMIEAQIVEWDDEINEAQELVVRTVKSSEKVKKDGN